MNRKITLQQSLSCVKVKSASIVRRRLHGIRGWPRAYHGGRDGFEPNVDCYLPLIDGILSSRPVSPPLE